MRVRRDEGGQVGGAEAIFFGVLVFVFGLLGIVSAWNVIDLKVAVASAAREAARTYVESSGTGDDRREAEEAGRIAFAGHGRDPAQLHVIIDVGEFQRCSAVTVTARSSAELPLIPVLRRVAGSVGVAARHVEIVDPYRSGLPRAGGDPCP